MISVLMTSRLFLKVGANILIRLQAYITITILPMEQQRGIDLPQTILGKRNLLRVQQLVVNRIRR